MKRLIEDIVATVLMFTLIPFLWIYVIYKSIWKRGIKDSVQTELNGVNGLLRSMGLNDQNGNWKISFETNIKKIKINCRDDGIGRHERLKKFES